MRRKQPETLGKALQAYIDSVGAGPKIRRARLVNSWARVVGPYVASITEECYLRGDKLVVKLYSSTARNELNMLRGQLTARLNQEAGAEIITDIILQ